MADFLPYFMATRPVCFVNGMRGTYNYPVYFVPSGSIIFDIIHYMGNIPHCHSGVIYTIFHQHPRFYFWIVQVFKQIILQIALDTVQIPQTGINDICVKLLPNGVIHTDSR
jgi:hypothetical protein